MVGKDKKGKNGRPADANGAGPSTAANGGAPHDLGGSAERLQQTFQQLTLMFEEEKKSFYKREEALRQEMAALQQEKDAMTAKAVKQSDIITINVGGTPVCATRSTLCQYPASLLASMFSGRWDDQMLVDSSGAVFLDLDPALFQILVNWLRIQSLAGPTYVMAEVPIPPGREEDMLVLVDYLQLQRYFPMWFVESFSPTLRSPTMQVRASTVQREEGQGCNYAVAVGSHTYFDVSVEVALAVNAYDCTEECGRHPMFIGVVAKDTVANYDLEARWDLTWQRTCYGWWIRPGQTFQVEAGRSRKLEAGSLWKAGDTVTLALDCRKDEREVTLKLLTASREERRITINPAELECPDEWVLLVGMTKSGSCVTIESAKRHGTPAWRFR